MKKPNVQLRKVDEMDLPIFFEHQQDRISYLMAGVPPREEAAFYAHWRNKVLGPDVAVRTIMVDGEVAGTILSWNDAGKQMVGYWLGQEHWGKGIGSRALEFFLNEMPVRPLYAHLSQLNLASRKVLEKNGFDLFEESVAFSEIHNRETGELLMILR